MTNEDYIFSVIKHRWPDAHDLVEEICKDETVAALMSPTDIVATAVRLATAMCKDENNNPLPDNEAIDKNQFHRLFSKTVKIKDNNTSFLDGALKPMIEKRQRNGLAELFLNLQNLLKLRDGQSGDIGLPVHALVLLDRPLIQAALFWILRMQEAGKVINDQDRKDFLQFVLYWSVFVFDPKKASRTAFSFLRKENPETFSWNGLYKEMTKDGSQCGGLPLYSLADVNTHAKKCVIAEPINMNKPLVGWKRFAPQAVESKEARECRELYQRWWTHGRGYVHPILLWLQREYVRRLPGSPVAGREEDTPYDYDHILPQSHWSNWTGVGGDDRILDFMDPMDKAYHVLGNAIGNVRVWSSSYNRSDGDASPKDKLPGREMESLINEKVEWEGCSPGENKSNAFWDRNRAEAFQRAVEKRSFELFKKFYEDLEYSEWIGTTKTGEN